MSALAQKHCVACERGTPPMSEGQARDMMGDVPGWTVENGMLTRDVTLKNFKSALALANKIGEVAEEEGHHPDISIHGWNHVKIQLITHSAGGLTENDFILAAKITGLLDQ